MGIINYSKQKIAALKGKFPKMLLFIKSKLPKFLFRNVDPDFSEEKLYNTLIIAMIIGLVITSILTFYFRTTLYSKKDSFSELYFPQPDLLPNLVRQNADYTYIFTVKSDENATANYNYTYGLELYRLYEYIESRYNCISRLRGRIFLEWTNESMNSSVIWKMPRYEKIQKLYVYPDYEKNINWSSYRAEFTFSPPEDLGILAIYFRNETDVKYSITLDDFDDIISINGVEAKKPFSLTEKNNLLEITIKNRMMNLSHNKETLMLVPVTGAKDGQFGFESQDAYYGIFNFKVYEDKQASIPDRGTVLEYNIKDNLFFNKLYEYRDLRAKSTPLIRQYLPWNEKIDCNEEPFYCKFFDLKNDVSFFIRDSNITRVIEKIPVLDENANFFLSPTDKGKATVDWKDFELKFSHDQIKTGNKGIIILKFSDKWAIMMTRNNSYFMRPFRNGVLIDEYRNPEKNNATLDEVYLNVGELKTTLQISNKTVFATDTPLDYANGYFEIFAKNTFMFINTLQMSNKDPICENPKFDFCLLTLESSRSSRERSNARQDDEYIIEAPKPEHATTFNLLKYIEPANKTSKESETALESKIDIKVDNPFIPDRRLIFNTGLNAIKNSSNFSIDFSYTSLDGARVIELGFQDYDGNELLSVYAIEKERQIIIYDGTRQEIKKLHAEINESLPHRLSMEIIKGEASFYADSKKIYEINKTDAHSGYFFVGSRNTYIDITGVRIDVRDRRISNPVRIKDDPCELKLIYREAKNEKLALNPDQSANMTRNFNIKRKFDYGKVFVELYGSGHTNATNPLEIHYWVIRQ